MNSQPTPTPISDDFLSLAQQLDLLDAKAVERLATESRESNILSSELALRRGVLDSVQIDIVELLLHPDDGIPGFELLQLMGQGGMGVVFRARQKSLDRVVALKTVLVSQMQDQTALTRFEQEALAVAKLRHPNIVTAYDLGRHHGRLYFVMELLDGHDLEQLVEEQGALDEATVLSLLRQAASGLSHAKDEGIIHRDVKPANILLVPPPAGFELPGGQLMVKITDFGLAFFTRDVETRTRLTQANATIGSPHYIAPEQLEADDFDYRVDIYGLGASAYHMLAGEPPFNSRKLSQIVTQKLTNDTIDVRDKNPQISSGVAELIKRMMHRDPKQRIGSYSELIATIDRLAPSPGTTRATAHTAPLPRSTMPIQRDSTATLASGRPPKHVPRRIKRGWRWPLIGSLAVVAMIFLGWWLWSPSHQAKALYRPIPDRKAELFDGQNLSNWIVDEGAWSAGKDDEGGAVILGADGTLRHPVVLGSGKPLEYYRLTTLINPQDAESAGVEFGIESPGSEASFRYAVEVNKQSISCGWRDSADGPFQQQARIVVAGAAARPQEITIERQANAWRVLSGSKVIATLPGRKQSITPFFQLRTAGKVAQFSDISLQELDSGRRIAE